MDQANAACADHRTGTGDGFDGMDSRLESKHANGVLGAGREGLQHCV